MKSLMAIQYKVEGVYIFYLKLLHPLFGMTLLLNKILPFDARCATIRDEQILDIFLVHISTIFYNFKQIPSGQDSV